MCSSLPPPQSVQVGWLVPMLDGEPGEMTDGVIHVSPASCGAFVIDDINGYPPERFGSLADELENSSAFADAVRDAKHDALCRGEW